MEQTPKTSFIPKQAVGVANRTRERRTFNVFAVIAMIGLLSILTLSAGLFFYQEYASRKLEAQKQGLADFKNRFDSSAVDDIREIKLLEDRFILAQDLLDKHLAVSELFYVLEDRIQQNAYIRSFTFERLQSGSANVTLEGQALSFNTLALQKRELNAETTFEDGSIIISNIGVETTEEGGEERVSFSVFAGVDVDQIGYVGEVSTATTSFATTSAAVSTSSVEAVVETSTP